jgi:hypothetical protein
MAYRWKFAHRSRVVEFGPYDTEYEAAVHFQMRYGYWPNPAIGKTLYPLDQI